MENSLKHYGILGMKWGKRRYQNSDGTLTDAGKARYAKKDTKWAQKNAAKITKKAYKGKNANSSLSDDISLAYKKFRSSAKSEKTRQKNVESYNKQLASIMNKSISNVTAPSGASVKFVAKTSELGVDMALVSNEYSVSLLTESAWNRMSG